MTEIGVFEAKTHLPALLKRVEAGEKFVITRHDRPVAELVPYSAHDAEAVRVAVDNLRDFRRDHSLDGLSVRGPIREGRRY